MARRGIFWAAAAGVTATLTATANAPEALGPAVAVSAATRAPAVPAPGDTGAGLGLGWPLSDPEASPTPPWDRPNRSSEPPISILRRPDPADAPDGVLPLASGEADGGVSVAGRRAAPTRPPADRPAPPADGLPAVDPIRFDPPILATAVSPVLPSDPVPPDPTGPVPPDPAVGSTPVDVPEPGGLWLVLAAVPAIGRGRRRTPHVRSAAAKPAAAHCGGTAGRV